MNSRVADAGKPVSCLVQAVLAGQVATLVDSEAGARRGDDHAIHEMRVSCRRLRAQLATFRPVLDREVTDPVREELGWLAGVLGTARDAAVVHERLRALVADEPRSLVHGPVRTRLRATYAGRGKPELRTVLGSTRYRDLCDRLGLLVADLPWTDQAEAPAREVVPGMLRRQLKRVRTRVRSARSADDQGHALHEVRKAAKRLRYAADAVEPVVGEVARRLSSDAHRLTSELGELQDTVVVRAELVALARAAATAGEPTFTYGRLHAREEAEAARLTAAYHASKVTKRLKADLREVVAALDDDEAGHR